MATGAMKPVVAIAGLGSMAQFLVDELLAANYKVIAISRAVFPQIIMV
jgi:prephenate dehydrogenase